MFVKKRSGELQEFDPTKILQRIQTQAQGLKVDSTHVYLQINNVLYDGVSTTEIDMEAARLSATFTSTHPDYSKLASNLVVSRLHKELSTGGDNWLTRIPQATANAFTEKTKKWGKTLDDLLYGYGYDYYYDYFGIQTFIKAYGLKNNKVLVELPCEMYARVAVLVSDTYDEYREVYDALLQKKISVATPILLNASTERNTLISCSLNTLKSDSKDGIFDTLRDVGTMSSDAAGIGLWNGNQRSKNTQYRQKGKAGGHVKFAKMLNENLQFFCQSENRRGAAALYNDLWHRDIIDHLNIRKQTTKETKAARDLFPAVCIPDLFYKRLLQDENQTWSLFCPHESLKYLDKPLYETWGEEFEKRYIALEQSDCSRDTISCKELMTEIVSSAAETGTPYIFNRDTVNRTYNQSNWGVSKSSNLCVAPETQILTKEGYITIGNNENKEVEVWNGIEWSSTVIKKTGSNQKLLKIVFSNDSVLHCTEYHKFYDWKNNEVRANQLYEGFSLEPFQLEDGSSHKIHVVSVEDINRFDDTYCVTEPLRNRVVFNHILTGNCIEYQGYSDAENSAQCCLCSIPVHNFVEKIMTNGTERLIFGFTEYQKAVMLAVRVLNKVIDLNEWSTETARKAGMEQRTIGIGYAGLADLALKLDMAFTSKEFAALNEMLAAHMYVYAIEASCQLAEENPEKAKALTKIQETPLAKGIFHCSDEDLKKHGFHVEGIRQGILARGLMNSLLIAPMPTASTSILLSCNEGFEGLSDLIISRETVSGTFTFFNKYLVQDLEEKGFWCKELADEILVKESLSDIDLSAYATKEYTNDDIAHLKEKYKTMWEIPMRTYIDLCAARQKYVDQGMSMNLYFKEASLSKIMSAYVYGWKMGLKTGAYYTKVKPAGNADKKLAVTFIEKKVKPANSMFECFNCGS